MEGLLIMTTKTHGGQRPGAGRPPKPLAEKYVQLSFRCPPGIAAWLEAHTENKSAWIVEAIRAAQSGEGE